MWEDLLSELGTMYAKRLHTGEKPCKCEKYEKALRGAFSRGRKEESILKRNSLSMKMKDLVQHPFVSHICLPAALDTKEPLILWGRVGNNPI